MQQFKISRVGFVLIFIFMIGIGIFFNSSVRAKTTSTPLAGEQLAYFIGYHSSPGYVYYGPHYYHHQLRKFYWTGWNYSGHGCRKNCLIDRWSGRIVRCNRQCRR